MISDLVIYELDPTGGFCGFPAEIPGLLPADRMRQELIRRSRVTNQIKKHFKIEVKRIFLRNAGALDNQIVKIFIQKEGIKAFPVFFYDNKILFSGSFPSFEVLAQKLKENVI
jgi:hypothetical protein